MALSEAVAKFVRPGQALHFAYGGGRPNATIAEIVRHFMGTEPRFRISAHGFVNTHHALVGAGLVAHLCVAFAGENYPAPRPNPVLQRAVADSQVTIENWSIWTLTARLMAGALGVSRFPVLSLEGSGIAAEHEGVDYDRGTGDQPEGTVSALRPDLVLVHGVAADEAGNVLLPAPYGEGRWGALAARTGVIATVEAIVPAEILRAFNTRPQIPGHLVRAVCHAPQGSHPYGLWTDGMSGVDSYAEDEAFMAELRRSARESWSFEAWIREWIIDPGDHACFLRKLSSRQPVTARRAPVAPKMEATPNERMTVVAARVIERRVLETAHQSVIGGIGFAHLAAWLAVERLAAAGVEVTLLAELGMAGLRPRKGNPYLFASQNLSECQQLTDVADVLGALVSGSAVRCLGVLGAGEVDADGNLNSTWSQDGRFLVGSGGANDIASTVDELIVVVRQDAGRLVQRVGYITAPGRNVSTIVTTEAVFERSGSHFLVTGSLLEPELSRAELHARLQAGTGWELRLADTVESIASPTEAELSALRAFDPESVFLKG